MASVKVYNMDGAEQGVLDLNEVVFGAPANDALLHEVVIGAQSAKRHGTHKTKTRAEVSGGGAKPFRQKGTGRARQGSIREPQMRGGGTVHGPVPRSYRKQITVRAKRQALSIALSERVRNGRLSVVRGFKLDTPKTKPVASMVSKLAPEGRKTLLVTFGSEPNVLLATRNLARTAVCRAEDLCALDVLGAVRIVVQEEALQQLEERLS